MSDQTDSDAAASMRAEGINDLEFDQLPVAIQLSMLASAVLHENDEVADGKEG